MDANEIRELLDGGESLRVEFKADGAGLSDTDIVETVVCLGNAEGGVILIGVEDSGRISGLGLRRRAEAPSSVAAMVFNRTDPPTQVVATRVDIDNVSILSIEVPASDAILATAEGKSVRRVLGIKGPECRPFPPSQHLGRLGSVGRQDYSAVTLQDVGLSDLDPIAADRLYELVRQTAPDLAELDLGDLLAALQLMTWQSRSQRGITVAGLLALGRESALRKYLPGHEIAYQEFGPGGDLHANEFSRLPLLRAIDEIERRFRIHTREIEAQIGLIRIGIPDYPLPSFREGLLNAVVHRDYTRREAVHVQLWPDRLLISSPGGFPAGVTLQNLLVTEPRARNQRLAEAFMRLGLVERAGRGIDSIFYNQLRFGRPAPDYSGSGQDSVRLELPGGAPSLEFVRLIFEQERQQRLTLQDILILNHLFHERALNPLRASQILQSSEGTARRCIEGLVGRGLVAARGAWREFALSESVYERLGLTAEYVRVEGGPRAQREQRHTEIREAVVRFLQSHATISRSEAAQILGVTPGEAKSALSRLRREGVIEMSGSRRTAVYRLL